MIALSAYRVHGLSQHHFVSANNCSSLFCVSQWWENEEKSGRFLMEFLARHGREKYSTVPLLERSWNVYRYENAFSAYLLIVSLLFVWVKYTRAEPVNEIVNSFDLLTTSQPVGAAKEQRWKPPRRDSQLTLHCSTNRSSSSLTNLRRTWSLLNSGHSSFSLQHI